jgi:DNA-binding PadR family transcriptional regulator
MAPTREAKRLSKGDLIVHPVRSRILMTIAGQQMTSQEIAEVLADVPQASLYRNIKRLADAGILRVVREIPIRGTLERVYAVAEGGAQLGEAELAAATPEDHLRYFNTFFASILSWLRGYLGQERIDPKADGLTCRGTTVFLTDAEYQELLDAVGALLRRAEANPKTPERRRRVIAWVAVPARRDRTDGTEESEA